MPASLVIMIALVVAAAGAVPYLPTKTMREALGISAKQAARVRPSGLPAAFIPGFLAEVLPKELVSGLVGQDSGGTGYALAAVAGSILPTGPMVVLPLGAALLQADAGLAQILTLYSAWMLVNVQRLVIWEIPLVGQSMAVRRFAGGLFAVPFAIASATLIDLLLAG